MSSNLSADTVATPTSNGVVAADRRAIIVAANKGGAGKSFFTQAWIAITRSSTSRRVSAWDLDGENGSLSLNYDDENPVTGVGLADVTDPSTTAWLDAMYDDSVDDVILDVPGGKTAALYQTFVGGPQDLTRFIHDAGRRIVLVSVIGTKKDTLPTVVDAIDTFGNSVEHVVLKNGFFGNEHQFVIFHGSTNDQGERKYGKVGDLAAKARAKIVFFPRLPGDTDSVLDVEGLSFARAVDAALVIGRKHAFNTNSWLDLVKKSLENTPLAVNGVIGARA